jgi:hypothetical protein
MFQYCNGYGYFFNHMIEGTEMSDKYHTSREIIGATRVHDEDHDDVGWVDKDGDVHRPGDTGGWFGNPDTIGHVDQEGNVTMGKK